jgi:hypothetical protein
MWVAGELNVPCHIGREIRKPPNAEAQLQAVDSICGSPVWRH